MDSIILDLDGTIWDPLDTVLKAWNHCNEKHSQIKSELTRTDFEGTMGLHYKSQNFILSYLKKQGRVQMDTSPFVYFTEPLSNAASL